MRRLFIIRKDLNMSPGKLAAQVGHCAEAYWLRLLQADSPSVQMNTDGKKEVVCKSVFEKEIFDEYINGAIIKTICEARNKNHLMKAKEMAEELNLMEDIDFGLIYDKCLTELIPEEDNGTTLTGIWFRPLSDETAHCISKRYQLYR